MKLGELLHVTDSDSLLDLDVIDLGVSFEDIEVSEFMNSPAYEEYKELTVDYVNIENNVLKIEV